LLVSAPGRALAILAHPDDAEFMAGGTIATWIDAGWQVAYLLCTNGGAGSEDIGMTAAVLSALRQAEQRAAADALGVGGVEFLDYPDGELQHTLDLRRQITRAVRRYRPYRVLCFDPTTRWYPDYINHADHWTSGEAALAAVFPAARERLAFPELLDEGLEPHKVMDIWLTGTLQPNHWVDIEAVLDRKLAAMLLHTSQVGDGAEAAAAIRARAATVGQQAPTPLAAAEAFRVIQMRR
jgi:LmbE family N-acetylglucosaminyl deacetylase